MSNFIKDSFNELSHVVWPTKKESRTYMSYVVGVIIVMSIILAILASIFRFAIQTGRHAVNPNSVHISTTDSDAYADFGIDKDSITVNTENTELTQSGEVQNNETTVSAESENTNTTEATSTNE